MRQWLYNHGNECVWNTGGWMKCLIGDKVTPITLGQITHGGTSGASVDFLSDRIKYVCNINVSIYYNEGYYYRPAVYAYATLGTKSGLVKDISAYKKMMVSNSNRLTGVFRIGSENSSSTDINTATIIQSGVAGDMDLAMEANHPFLVLGNKYIYSQIVRAVKNPGNISVDHNCEITEIWLE